MYFVLANAYTSEINIEVDPGDSINRPGTGEIINTVFVAAGAVLVNGPKSNVKSSQSSPSQLGSSP